MTTDDPLKRPLVFGDKEQTEALRKLERETFWKTLANCANCGGDGLCPNCCPSCDHECEDCDGLGKTTAAYADFVREFPLWKTPTRQR